MTPANADSESLQWDTLGSNNDRAYYPPDVYAPEQSDSFFGNWSAKDKETLLWIVGGTFVGITGFLIARHYIKKAKGAQVQQQIVFEGNPASYAQDLINAFQGWGTDEDAVYKTFAAMPSQDFYAKVAKAYKDHPDGGNLGDDLGSELASDELQIVRNIIMSKPVKTGGKPNYSLLPDWSQRLTKAYEGWGTDEAAIYEVLYEVPDKNGLLLLNQQFSKDNNGYSLLTMLNDELSGDELQKAKNIIATKK